MSLVASISITGDFSLPQLTENKFPIISMSRLRTSSCTWLKLSFTFSQDFFHEKCYWHIKFSAFEN